MAPLRLSITRPRAVGWCQKYEAEVVVESDYEVRDTLVVRRGAKVLMAKEVEVRPGRNAFRVRDVAPFGANLLTLRAQLGNATAERHVPVLPLRPSLGAEIMAYFLVASLVDSFRPQLGSYADQIKNFADFSKNALMVVAMFELSSCTPL
ncbi:MAG: hypothetical protein ACPL3C_09160 [Pyrobaculum sp.]